MRRRNIFILLILAVVVLIVYMANWHEASDEPEDQGKTLDKDGSVETAISVQHADNTHDVLLTSHKVWIKNKEYTTIVHRDTIPTLDSLNTTAEAANGDTSRVRVKKDYQLFITVK